MILFSKIDVLIGIMKLLMIYGGVIIININDFGSFNIISLNGVVFVVFGFMSVLVMVVKVLFWVGMMLVSGVMMLVNGFVNMVKWYFGNDGLGLVCFIVMVWVDDFIMV